MSKILTPDIVREELEKDGFTVEQVTHKTEANKENRDYLETKASKMNHKL